MSQVSHFSPHPPQNNILPDDVWTHLILPYVTNIRDMVSLSEVDRQLNRLSREIPIDHPRIKLPPIWLRKQTAEDRIDTVEGWTSAWPHVPFFQRIVGPHFGTDLLRLRNLSHLSLSIPDLRDVGLVRQFENLRSVRLCGHPFLEDLTPISHVPDVTLKSLPRVTDLGPLANCARVRLEQMTGVWDLEPLRRVPTVELDNLPLLTKLEPLEDCETIHIENLREVDGYFCESPSQKSIHIRNTHVFLAIETNLEYLLLDRSTNFVFIADGKTIETVQVPTPESIPLEVRFGLSCDLMKGKIKRLIP